MRINRLLLAASSASLLSAAALAQTPCITYPNSPAGTVMTTADDEIYNVALPFSFPFDGNVYDTITISTNGWVKLGQATATSSQYTTSEASMLDGDPRIAVCWDDLSPGQSSSGDLQYWADATQASICYQNVRRFGVTSNPNTYANCELILLPTGEMYFYYDATCTMDLSTSDQLVGISRGYSQVPLGTSFVDWSNANGGTVNVVNATGYELFAPGSWDLLGGVVLHWLPTGIDTYDVTYGPALGTCAPGSYPQLAFGPTSYGVGCPPPAPNGSLYEEFSEDLGINPMDTANTSMLFQALGEEYTLVPGPGFDMSYTSGTVLTLGDEQMIALPVGAMGVFPFGDSLITEIRLSSNGWIGLDASFPLTGPGVANYQGNPGEFNSQGPRIAACWVDHNPGAGGTIYWDNTDPSFSMITFENVAQYADPSTCTWQVKIFNNGDVLINHGADVGTTTGYITPIVGITRGNAADPGADDFVSSGVVNTIGPVDIVGVNPINHTASQLAIGKEFSMSATYSGAILGFFIVGFNNPGFPLDALGATGCSAYATLDILEPALFTGSSMNVSLPGVPYDPVFSGATIFTQAAAFSPVNAFGIVSSNGLQHECGL